MNQDNKNMQIISFKTDSSGKCLTGYMTNEFVVALGFDKVHIK